MALKALLKLLRPRLHDCSGGTHLFGQWSKGTMYQWRYCKNCGEGECREIRKTSA